jgi:hypothetical protein
MKKTTSLLASLLILFIFMGCCSIMPVSARNYLQKTSSSITMMANQTETVILDPLGQQSTVQLTVTYTYGRFARPQGFPFPNRKMPTIINISISKQPDWCLLSLDRGSFEIPIQTFFLKKNQTKPLTVNLTMQCQNQSARANQANDIRFNVTAQQNGNIQSCQSVYNLSIAPDYFLRYTIITTSSRFITMEYGAEKNTTVILKNLGNSKTTFHIQPQTTSNLVNISFDHQQGMTEFSLDINEERNLTIMLKSSQIKGNPEAYTLLLNVTTHATDSPAVQGPTQDLILQVSLETPEKLNTTSFDTSIYLVYLAAFFIILPLVILLIYSRRKKTRHQS